MKREKLSKAAASGAVALIFLVLGFQAAIFTGNVFKYNREHRVDTVYVSAPPGSDGEGQLCEAAIQSKALSPRSKVRPKPEPGRSVIAKEKAHRQELGITKGIAPQKEPDYSDSRRVIAEKMKPKPEPELFQFDPNTITHDDLVRLGFSDKQAQVIENYRSKGGKYTSPRDFAKMYVVDSVMYARLEPYIKIRKLDLNTADSLALLGLRGIGPYYAHKILEYRRNLGGVFTSREQLLEIDGIDAERLEGFAKMVEIGRARPFFTLWDADRTQLARHPYIGSYATKGIIRYKSVTDTAAWSLDGLVENGIIRAEDAARLRYLDGGAGQGHHE
jgi:DNA uptake protein ComE-like DNA-binding protein